MPEPSTTTAVVTGRWRSLLELVGLSGLTVTQPVLATFGDSPDFFVFREASRGGIVAFGVVVALLPGVTVWGLSTLAGLWSSTARGLVHEAGLAFFVALGSLQLTAGAGLSLGVGGPVAVGAGVGLVVARRRWSGLRAWLRVLAPAPIVFLAMFLVVSPVSDLVAGGEVDPAELGAFGSGDPPPVVVLVFDEWPLSSLVRADGTIDAQLAPNVARLAERSTWYRNATTVSNMTNFAVPALLTGNEPEQDDRATAFSQPENLFTLLAGNYRLDTSESITRLCPTSLCDVNSGSTVEDRADRLAGMLGEAASALGDRLVPGAGDEPVTDGFVEPDAAVGAAAKDEGNDSFGDLLAPRPERLTAFTRGIDGDEDPTVHYLHLLAPHTPHRHSPQGIRYPSDPGLRLISEPDGSEDSDLRADVEWPARLDRQRLLLEVGYVDGLVGDVIDRLESTGLYDEATVVLTSDHGLAFTPGASARGIGDRRVERSIEPDLLWVPLLIKAPGQSVGEVSDVDARTIDVVPTVAGVLGIDMPWEVDGVDLTQGAPDRGPKQFTRVQGSSFAAFELDPPVEVRAELDEVFSRGTDRWLRGEGGERWWKVGPRPDLIGRRVGDDAFTARAGPDVTFDLDRPDSFDDVDPASGDAPLLVSGRVDPGGAPAPAIEQVAVVIGGEVAAVVPTYDDGGGPGRFAAMISPSSYEQDDTGVRLAAVTTEGDETVLGFLQAG